jgi:hypothetical protein
MSSPSRSSFIQWQQRHGFDAQNFGANGTAAVWGAGDFNGDSKSDILWQHDNGTAAIWTMDGTDVLSVGAAGSFNPGADWHLIV